MLAFLVKINKCSGSAQLHTYNLLKSEIIFIHPIFQTAFPYKFSCFHKNEWTLSHKTSTLKSKSFLKNHDLWNSLLQKHTEAQDKQFTNILINWSKLQEEKTIGNTTWGKYLVFLLDLIKWTESGGQVKGQGFKDFSRHCFKIIIKEPARVFHFMNSGAVVLDCDCALNSSMKLKESYVQPSDRLICVCI